MSRTKKSPLGLITFTTIIILAIAYFVFRPENYPTKSWDTAKVVIDQKEITAYLAKTPLEKEKGLGGFNLLDDDQGMLFEFESLSQPGFWMRGMKFDIDIVWIFNHEIIEITPNVRYKDEALTKYYPNQSVDAVLEVNAGYCRQNGVEAGDEVRW